MTACSTDATAAKPSSLHRLKLSSQSTPFFAQQNYVDLGENANQNDLMSVNKVSLKPINVLKLNHEAITSEKSRHY